jgi:hypothetical protein
MKKDSKLDYAKDFTKNMAAPSPKEIQIQLVLNAMKKYDNNHWWENKDERVLAYWQVKEPILIIPWEVFHRGMSNLLGRKVTDKEYAFSVAQLKIEAARAYAKLMFRKDPVF